MVGYPKQIHMGCMGFFAIVLLCVYFFDGWSVAQCKSWTTQYEERSQDRGGFHGYRIQFDRLMVEEHTLALLPTTLSRAQKTDFSFKMDGNFISSRTQKNYMWNKVWFKWSCITQNSLNVRSQTSRFGLILTFASTPNGYESGNTQKAEHKP